MKLKKEWVIFSLALFIIAFSVGFILQIKVSKNLKKNLKMCENNICTKGALSVFSQELLEKARAQFTTHPAGFCLSVPVLLYHHVQPQADSVAKGQTSLSVDNTIFDEQMAYLASNGYTAISAQHLVDAIMSHTAVPAKSVVITLDDAYLDNFTYAFPVLQKYHLLGNFMVPTGLLGNNAGTNSYFTWDQLKQMVNAGMQVYNHTWSHYSMGTGPVEKDVYEVATAQKQLQEYLGKVSPIFVYPYGSGQTVGWVQSLLKQNGFIAAFSTLGGVYQCEGNIMALPRIHIGNAPMSGYGL